MVRLEFFDPSGSTDVAHGHAPRLKSMEGKKIGFLSNGQWQSFRALPLLKQYLEEDFPGIEVLPPDTFPEGSEIIDKDSTIEQVKASGVDAVILGNAACGACSTACGVAAGKLEKIGIPTVTLTRQDFIGVVRNSAGGLGLPADLSMVTFPIDLFLPGSDLESLSDRRREFYDGLTSWSAELRNDSVRPMITVEGVDYQDALSKANNMFMVNRWGDGLPLWPASRELVDSILRGTDLPRDHLLGRFPPRGGLATVEACAVALAMAGGRPEYLPVLIASVEAMLDPAAGSAKMQATSGATFPVIIVNGPIAKDIRLNSGFGCLGPDPQHPAGAAIGRALRQMQQNLGGALPGTGTMAPWGAMRSTNVVFAEDEDGLPEGWLPHGTERHGFRPGTNSVSFYWAHSALNIVRRGAMKESLEQDVLEGMHRVAACIGSPMVHYTRTYTDSTPGAVLLTKVVADYLASTGWDKQKVREFLWENSRIPQETLRKCGMRTWIEISPYAEARKNIDLDPWPITSKPEDIILVVAGGGHPTHAFWMPAFSAGVIGREISVPAGFRDLLTVSDYDLGSGGEACMI
jgi:hypothetical protein